jgi:hypothetical protein
MRKYLKIALITAVIIIVIGPLLALAFLYVGLHGGLRGAMLSLKPRPDLERADIKGKREKLRAEIESAFVRVMGNTEFIAREASSYDVCYDGVHTWTMVDEYAHRCTLRLTRFYGFDDSFRDKMIAFEHRILAAGWDQGRTFRFKSGYPMEYYMTNYYDVRHGRHPTVADVPVQVVARPLGYHSDSARLQMEIVWAEQEARSNGIAVNALNLVQRSSAYVKFFEQLDLREGSEVLAEVTRGHKYVLALAISGHYVDD